MTPRPGSENEADPNGQNPNGQNPNGQTPGGQTPPDQPPAAGGPAVERIIERFGGIRPMAHKLDIPVTTVQGWKKRGAIPLARHADLRTAAAKHRVKLDEADLEAATPSEDRTAPDAADSVTPVPPETPATTTAATTTEAAAVAAPEGVEPVKPVDAEPAPTGPGTTEPVIIAGSSTPGKAGGTGADGTGADGTGADGTGADKPDAGKTGPDAAAAEPAVETVRPASDAGYTATHGLSQDPNAYPREERRSGAGFATFVSLVALLVGAAALSEPWWGPRVPGWPARTAATQTAGQTAAPAQPAQPDPALRSQIQQIAERVGRLEQRPAATNGGTAGGGVDPQVLENALRQLSGRIDQLDQRVQQASAGSAAAAEPDPRVNQLAERLGGIEQRVAAVSGNTQAAEELRKEVDGLKQQLASVNQAVETVNQAVETRRDAAASAQALVLAAGQLRASLATGQPFQQELQAVRALGVGDPQVTQPLDAVSAYAAKGVPTQPQLADRFQAMASDIVRAANQGEGGDWVGQVTGKLATLVTVRRQGGGVVGDSADAVVARAESAVQEGNLAKAVEELSTLKGPAADVAAPWIADAKARLAANQAGQQLTSRAIGLMSQAAGGAAGGTKGNGQ